MSSVVIAGDTSGTVTLQAPAVSGTTVLTLPATSGTVLTTASGTASSATTATNITGGVAGAVPYQSASGTTGFSAAGTTGQSLLSAGSGIPTWGTPASATTATNLAGGSNGTIPYQTASGTTAMLAAGTSGYVLQANGVAAPTWVAPSTGALTLISTQTLSSVTTLTVTSGISSTYKRYKIYVSIEGGGTNFIPFIRFYAGSVDTASIYPYRYYSSAGLLTGTTGTSIQIHDSIGGANAQNAWNLEITVSAPYSQLTPFAVGVYTSGVSGNGVNLVSASGGYNGSTGNNVAITGFFIGNAASASMSGTVSLYGISS